MKKLIILGVSFSCLCLFVAYASLPLLIKKEFVQTALIKNFESLTGQKVLFESLDLRYFPIPTATLVQPAFFSRRQESTSPILKAEKVRFYLNPLHFLIGRMSFLGIAVEEGESELSLPEHFPIPRVALRHMKVSVSSLRTKEPIRISLEADLEGMPKALKFDGFVTVKTLETWIWPDVILEGALELRDCKLAFLMQHSEEHRPEFTIQDGTVSGKLQMKKDAGSAKLSAEGGMTLKQFVYQVSEGESWQTSPPIDGDLNIATYWDSGSSEAGLSRFVLTTPLGVLEANGLIHVESGEIKGFRVTLSGLNLENVPQYFLKIRDAVPVNIGFSGPSDLDISIEGTLDHLRMHANIDLSKALFNYSRYFSKPKDLPFNITFDFILKSGKILSGDFTVHVESANLKGTLTGVDILTTQGQLNIITNKFTLKGWEQLLPPFSQHQLDGEVKILFNWNGFFKEFEQGERVLNVTLENASFLSADGNGLRGVNVVFDYGPVAFEIKKAQMESGSGPVLLEFMIYNLNDKPLASGIMSSSRLEPYGLLSSVRGVVKEWAGDGTLLPFQKYLEDLNKLFIPGEIFQNVSFKIGYDEHKTLSLKDIQFENYDGKGLFNFTMDRAQEPPRISFEGEINKVSLAKYVSARGGNAAPVEGNLFIKIKASGSDTDPSQFLKSWSGTGNLSMTNGEFKNFDLLKTVADLSDFGSLLELSRGATPFDDVRFDFVLGGGKIQTDNLVGVSKDFTVEGTGEIDSAGLMNFGLQSFLSPELSGKAGLPVLGIYRMEDKNRIGPIPVLLSGTLENPELKTDPALISELKEKLLANKNQASFRTFLPEDSFFDKRAS